MICIDLIFLADFLSEMTQKSRPDHINGHFEPQWFTWMRLDAVGPMMLLVCGVLVP